MTVAGIDLHILSVFKHFGDKILEQAASRPSSHTFFYAFIEGRSIQDIVYEFTTDQQLWKGVRPESGGYPKMLDKEKRLFDELRQKANKISDKVFSANLSISNRSYFCSVSRTSKLHFLTVFCEEI